MAKFNDHDRERIALSPEGQCADETVTPRRSPYSEAATIRTIGNKSAQAFNPRDRKIT